MSERGGDRQRGGGDRRAGGGKGRDGGGKGREGGGRGREGGGRGREGGGKGREGRAKRGDPKGRDGRSERQPPRAERAEQPEVERPGTPRRPVGIERAARSRGAPPLRRSDERSRARRPDIPPDVEVDLPRSVMGELRRNVRDVDDVARALTLAGHLVADDEPGAAIAYLAWAKQEAPRAPSVREALGIAHYLNGDWQEALSELQAYRRLTGRQDQNHLLADCQRALGRPVERVAELVQEMDRDRVGADRYTEGIIIWASALADGGDPAAGRAVLGRLVDELRVRPDPPAHVVRLWYVAGDLAERDGDREEAERWFRRVAAVGPDLFDVDERLARFG